MTDLMTRFDITVHDRLERVRDRVEAIKNRAIPENSDLDVRLEMLGESLEAQQERLETARKSFESFVDVKVENFREWRDERKIDRLTDEASDAQRRAEAAIEVAMGALDEAEIALTTSAIAQDTIEFLQDAD